MIFSVKFNDFKDYDAIDRIFDRLKNHDVLEHYNIFIEYKSDIESFTLTDEFMLEIKPDHLRFLKELRERLGGLDMTIKKIYLLGSISVISSEELRVTLEKASATDQIKNIIWPSKELFLYDGSKKILDSLLENAEIDYDEYEVKLKILQMEFGLLDFLEEDYYVN